MSDPDTGPPTPTPKPDPPYLDVYWTWWVSLPPRPMIPQQTIVNPDGTPTFEYNLFLTQQYEWERRLLSVLTGTEYPERKPSGA